MRNACADELVQQATRDSRLVLLSGDIGNRLFDPYKEKHGDRFFNCGVAEANMIGMAAGMALNGLKPVVYTIASFLLYRPFEQIRIDIGYHNLPVVLIGVGGGLSYASNAGSHHSMEDIALMRAIPGMQIICAGDAWEVRAGLAAALDSNRPTYLRIGKKGEPEMHAGAIENFQIGKAIEMQAGEDIAVLSTGNLLPIASETAKQLQEKGTSCSLHSMHTVNPLDEELLSSLFENRKQICVIEEHNISGGLGTAILEWCNLNNKDSRKLLRLGGANAFLHRTANQNEAREIYGLTPDALTEKILAQLNA